MVDNEHEFTIDALTWEAFKRQLDALVPGVVFEPGTLLTAIPAY